MLKISQVTKKYGKKVVLNNCSFEVNKGEIVGIMGESGSGKSTLARLICGLEKPTTGNILVNGRTYSLGSQENNVQMVFQDSLAAVHSKWSIQKILEETKQDRVSIEQVLADVGLEKTVLSKRSNQLSGGQLQRVCIARALLVKPAVIIFDESLSGLDPYIQGQLLRLLFDLRERYNQTYVFIAHDYKLCETICHRVIHMTNGQITHIQTEFPSDS